MKAKLIGWLVSALLKALPKEMVRRALDAMLDAIEDHVENTANKIDDATVLPTCKFLREVLNIPDND